MAYKFERLEVWQMALEYAELIYDLADKLPRAVYQTGRFSQLV